MKTSLMLIIVQTIHLRKIMICLSLLKIPAKDTSHSTSALIIGSIKLSRMKVSISWRYLGSVGITSKDHLQSGKEEDPVDSCEAGIEEEDQPIALKDQVDKEDYLMIPFFQKTHQLSLTLTTLLLTKRKLTRKQHSFSHQFSKRYSTRNK